MSIHLSDDDGRAVDLLLDRLQAAGEPLAHAASDAFVERLSRVQNLLALFKLPPCEEVPAGLCDRTMQRIDGYLRRAAEKALDGSADAFGLSGGSSTPLPRPPQAPQKPQA